MGIDLDLMPWHDPWNDPYAEDEADIQEFHDSIGKLDRPDIKDWRRSDPHDG